MGKKVSQKSYLIGQRRLASRIRKEATMSILKAVEMKRWILGLAF